MDNFHFHLYTDVLFGKGVENHAGEMVKKHGGTKVLLVYGGGSVKKNGLYDRVVDSLNAEGIPFVDFGGVQPNPLLSKAWEGVELANKEGCDFFLAIGGGSAIDTAKGIALGVANPGVDFFETYYINKVTPPKMMPVGTIHTITATGSEMSRSSVLRDEANSRKQGFMHDPCRPVFALMNPEYTYTLPAYQTAAGAADVFAHTLERYFYPASSYLADAFGEAIMRNVVRVAPVALANPTDYESHAELMLSGSFAHNDLAGLGHLNLGQEGSCHALERQMGGLFNTTHGAGLAMLMPAWVEYTAAHSEDKSQYVKFATNVFGVEPDPEDDMKTITEGVRRFRAWVKEIGMPLTFKDMGIDHEGIELLIEKNAPAPGKTQGTRFPLTREDYANIYFSVEK